MKGNKKKTPMEKLSGVYENFIKRKELYYIDKELFDCSIKKAATKLRGSNKNKIDADDNIYSKNSLLPKDELNDGSPAKVTLEDYLLGDGKRILPFLIKNYQNQKPRDIANMLFALIELEYFDSYNLLADQTHLIHAISISFNKNLSRQSLSYHFPKRGSLNPFREKLVAKEVKKIQEAITAEFRNRVSQESKALQDSLFE